MDNHFHIVVETIEGNLSAGMRQLNGVYAQPHPQPGRSRLSGSIQSHHRAARSLFAGAGALRGARPRAGRDLRLAGGLALVKGVTLVKGVRSFNIT